MSDKKHIDRLFQEKFKDFEVAPNDAVWKNIEQRLDKKKKRRVIPIWWQVGGAAAALVLLFAIGNAVFNTEDTVPQVVDTETPSAPNNPESETNATDTKVAKEDASTIIASEDSENPANATNTSTVANSEKASNANQNTITTSNSSNATFDVASTNTKTSINSDVKQNVSQKTEQAETIVAKQENTTISSENTTDATSQPEIKSILENTTSSENAIANTEISEKNTTTDTSQPTETTDILNVTENTQTIEDAIAEANTTNEKEKEKLRRWSIAPNVAPVYFNSLGGGSSIDEQFNANATSGAITMSYGVDGSYAINKRLKVTTGVHRVSLNNTTNDVIALSDNTLTSRDATAVRMENVTLNSTINNGSLMVMSRANLTARSAVPEAINTLPAGDLEQRFGFIEIPLELEYKVVDKKLGVNVIGGFSTLFLNENDIFADVNGESTRIGQANNINDTSFSANFGIGVDYSLSEKLNINLEPKFKYQLNTFDNTTGDFQPFFIGVYTGLSFKF